MLFQRTGSAAARPDVRYDEFQGTRTHWAREESDQPRCGTPLEVATGFDEVEVTDVAKLPRYIDCLRCLKLAAKALDSR